MKNLFRSLASFQQEVPVIIKNSQGYGYQFADLPKIFEVINPLLQKHGLGFTQLLQSKDGLSFIVTLIFHVESGENIESQIIIPNIQLKGMNDFQSFGSGVTYFRRYALAAALGLVTDKDTDAAGEQEKPVNMEKKPKIEGQRFLKAIEAIRAGEYTAEELDKNFDLNEVQKKSLLLINQ